ncbi:MAG: hypothetical protein ACOVMT_06295, partial [Caulobacter sp.]
TSPPSVEYALTPLGQGLVPALEAIVTVGHQLKAARTGEAAPASKSDISAIPREGRG